MSIAHISYILALWAASTGNSTSSNVLLVLVLLALVLPAPVLLAPVLPVPALLYTGARNPKETLSTRNYTIHDEDDRDVRNKYFVILLHNFKGIYDVLSRIWKCRISRVFGANFLGRKFRLVLYFLLFATMTHP